MANIYLFCNKCKKVLTMNDAITAKTKISAITKNQPINLNWTNNLSAQELLDVVASIFK